MGWEDTDVPLLLVILLWQEVLEKLTLALISSRKTGFRVPNYLGFLSMCGYQIFIDIYI
jgi:hypothetical protein